MNSPIIREISNRLDHRVNTLDLINCVFGKYLYNVTVTASFLGSTLTTGCGIVLLYVLVIHCYYHILYDSFFVLFCFVIMSKLFLVVAPAQVV